MAEIPVFYDICIVGAGLIGSAAAKYASRRKDLKVALIGPEEPKVLQMADNINGIASHYDESRFSWSVEIDPTWAALNQRSIAKYGEIEQTSGISFYSARGLLSVNDSDSIKSLKQAAERDCIHVDSLCSDQLDALVGSRLNHANGFECIHESTTAGILNPRKLVAAQMAIALNQGCNIIRDIVLSIEKTIGQNGSTFHRLTTKSGNVYHATKVLLTTGVSLYYNNLIDRTIRLKFTPVLFTAVKCEVSREDAETLSNMPCLDYHGAGIHCRIVPPVQYPDDRYYLKISSHDLSMTKKDHLISLKEMRRWYNGEGEDNNVGQNMANLCPRVLPDIKILSWHITRCSGFLTPSGLPYVDMIDENKAVVFACNGIAAKCSDELGLMAAELIVNGQWNHDLPAAKFKLIRE